jgi:hypothetical protein
LSGDVVKIQILISRAGRRSEILQFQSGPRWDQSGPINKDEKKYRFLIFRTPFKKLLCKFLQLISLLLTVKYI